MCHFNVPLKEFNVDVCIVYKDNCPCYLSANDVEI